MIPFRNKHDDKRLLKNYYTFFAMIVFMGVEKPMLVYDIQNSGKTLPPAKAISQ